MYTIVDLISTIEENSILYCYYRDHEICKYFPCWEGENPSGHILCHKSIKLNILIKSILQVHLIPSRW